jgi:flagellar hook protein FlgE
VGNGSEAGGLTSFSVSADGQVLGLYSNGTTKNLGQIALATFANPGGLMKMGTNMFSSTANSGDANVGLADSGGRGSLANGYLEMSNVDLAEQFTNMIMAERGFQANSRVITTSDEVLQDLVNLKR